MTLRGSTINSRRIFVFSSSIQPQGWVGLRFGRVRRRRSLGRSTQPPRPGPGASHCPRPPSPTAVNCRSPLLYEVGPATHRKKIEKHVPNAFPMYVSYQAHLSVSCQAWIFATTVSDAGRERPSGVNAGRGTCMSPSAVYFPPV